MSQLRTGLVSTLMASLIAVSVPVTAFADSNGTVYLKSGGRISGELVEVMPGQYVVVKTATGEVKKFPWAEVDHLDDPAAGGKTVASPTLAKSPDAIPGGSGDATIIVRSTKPETEISRVTGRSMGVGYGNGGSVTVVGMSWVDLCVAPCEYKLPAGLHELRLDGPGLTPTTHKFNLVPGENRILAKPGSSGLFIGGVVLFSLGLSGLIVGGTFWGTGAAIGGSTGDSFAKTGKIVTLISVPVTLGGIVMWVAGSSSMEVDQGQSAMVKRPSAPRGLTFNGSF